MPIFAIWREPTIALGSPGLCKSMEFFGSLGVGRSLGLDKPCARRSKGSPVVQIPEKSGLLSAIRGVGADMSTLPSAFRGTPAVGYLTHCAAEPGETKNAQKRKRAAATS